MNAHQVVLNIADIVFLISSDDPALSIEVGETYRPFVANGEPEATVVVKREGIPDLNLQAEHEIWRSKGPWSLHQIGDRKAIVFQADVLGPHPFLVGIYEPDFRRGIVYDKSLLPTEAPDVLVNPLALEYPQGFPFVVWLLSQRRGVMVHASGIKDGERGYLFVGDSGHGKTTMARLWIRSAVVLNDDRIILRKCGGQFRVYGTPWHGELDVVSPESVPLDKVFFLRRAEENRAGRIKGAAAVSRLLEQSFTPFWDVEGMRFTVNLCAQLVSEVPCYDLGFRPDESIVDFIRDLP